VLQVVAECCRLLQVVAECCRVLQSVAEFAEDTQFSKRSNARVAKCSNMLQVLHSVTECCKGFTHLK